MKFSKLISIGLISTFISLSANAGLIDYAVTTNINGNYTGGDNTDSTYNEIDSQNKALASLTGIDLLPTLKVMAQGARSYSRALSVQKFTYSGAEAYDFVLNFNLHGDVSSTATSPLRADIGIILADQVNFYSSSSFSTNFFEGGGLMGKKLGYEALFLGNGVNKNAADSITFNIQPGDSFFVYASVRAYAKNGFVNAWNTLTMNFTDSSGLQAGSFIPPQNAIPEPPTVVLMLLALFIFSRRQQT